MFEAGGQHKQHKDILEKAALFTGAGGKIIETEKMGSLGGMGGMGRLG